MTDTQLRICKVVIAALGCMFLLWREHRAHPRWAAAFRLTLAAAAVGAYFHGFALPIERYYHRWEMFHYYLGAKYASELGYTRLYQCVAIADAQTGYAPQVSVRRARDLTTDELIRAQIWLRDPTACKRHFSGARWSDFTRDVSWFREAAGGGAWWEQMQQDHGYNASPIWTMIARPLASLAPASDQTLRALAAIDPLLMAACLVALGWAFGFEIAALAALFWGTQAAAEVIWTGGAFLRQDWLLCAVLGVALLKRRRPFTAGVLLTAAGLLRVFPLLLWAGPLLVIGASMLRNRRISQLHRRLLAGGALCALISLGASVATQGSADHADFVRRLTVHAASPISNHISLRTLLSASGGARLETMLDASQLDPARPWAEARRERSDQLRWLQLMAASAVLVAFGTVVLRARRLWVATSLSIVLIPVLTDPSCYYYSVFLLAVPLCAARHELALVLVMLAGAGQLLALRFTWVDDRFVALSALYLACAVALLIAFSGRRAAQALFAPATHPKTLAREGKTT